MSTRAFHGSHDLTVMYSGEVVLRQELILTDKEDLVVHLQV